jgi:hypothetical protein
MHGRSDPIHPTIHAIHAIHEGILAKRRLRGNHNCFENGYPRIHSTRGRILGNGGLPFCPSPWEGGGRCGPYWCYVLATYLSAQLPSKGYGTGPTTVVSSRDGIVFWPDPCRAQAVCLSVKQTILSRCLEVRSRNVEFRMAILRLGVDGSFVAPGLCIFFSYPPGIRSSF